MAKKSKKANVKPEDYEIPYTSGDVNIRIKEYLDKEGKGAAGKTSQEMKKKHKLIEKNGKYVLVEKKKKGGMVNSKSIAKKYFKGGMV